jgi:hypothetical protein
VQSWLDEASTNFGWAVVGEETNQTSKRFDSRENPDATTRPVLTITYDEPVFPGLIQGQKWHDLNANGQFDSDEDPLNGWTIQLIDATGTVIETARTASIDLNGDGQINPRSERGVYSFDVLPGEYTVREVQQTDWYQSAPQFTSNLRPDNLITNATVTSEGAGAVWYVLNQDTNELTYQISTDELDDSVTAIYIHDGNSEANGTPLYDLISAAGGNNSGLIAGQVVLSDSEVVKLQAGELYIQVYTSTWPNGELRDQILVGSDHRVTVTNNAEIYGRDFGNYQLTSIAGRKWYDANNDGVRLSQEVLDLGLFIQSNNLYFDAYDGAECWFRGVNGEWYFLTADGMLTEWDRTPFALTGTVVAQLDPLFYNDPTAIVRVSDTAEPFLNGWTIELLNGNGDVVATDVTHDIDSNGDGIIDPETERGHYSFDDLIPDNYDVREFQQDGWAQTATVTSPMAETAWEIDQQLGLYFDGQYHTNFGGIGEHWLRGDDDGWYYITSVGGLYEWDGTSGGDSGSLAGNLVATLSHEYHDNPALLHDAVNPDLDTLSGSRLVDIDFGNYQTVSINGRKWHDTNNDGLKLPDDFNPFVENDSTSDPFLFNIYGSNEYWFQNESGDWYFLLADGNIYEWDGTTGSATGTVSIYVGEGFYHNPDLLVSVETAEPFLNGWTVELLDDTGAVIAIDVTRDIDLNDDGSIDPKTERGWYAFDDLPPGTYTVREVQQEGWVQVYPVEAEFAQAAIDLDQVFDFHTDGNFFRDFGGMNEVWIQDGTGAWFYITEDGSLFEWDRVSTGSTGLSGTLITTLSSSFNLNPSLLYAPKPIDVTLLSGGSINNYDFANKQIGDEI